MKKKEEEEEKSQEEQQITPIIIHQTHYEKSDWSRAFNRFTIACELDMKNAISVTDVAFIAADIAFG